MVKNFLLYLQSVRELGLPYLEFKGLYTLSFKVGRKKYFIRGLDTPFNDGASISLARNKYCVNQMLARAKFPVPKAVAITSSLYQQGKLDLAGLKFPLVIKPTVESADGYGVVCNIQDEATLREELDRAFQHYPCMSIEEFHGGLTAYRVLVFYGEVIAVVERIPAEVIGDGAQTVAALIQAANAEREKLDNPTLIGKIDTENSELLLKLKQEGMTLDSIVDRGKKIVLRHVSSSMQGGAFISRGVDICVETAESLREAADRLGLNFVGFDFLCEDIKKPPQKNRDVIIDVSHNPDVTMYEEPMSGEPVRVTKTMLSRFVRRNQEISVLSWFNNSKITKSFYFRGGLVAAVLVVVFKFIF